MSNFYGKRFLSSLVGALTVLGSPVASARDDKLGKGNLKGRGGSSARRDKNNGKLGKLKSNRAGNNGSGRGDLGKGVPSASRDKNNGKLGKLKSNRVGDNGSGRGDLGKGVPSASRDKNNGKLGKLKSNRVGNNGSGRGDLGKGVPSASRDKNNGKLGELKSNRKVKSIGDLKKVLKETGGKVVRVVPDGKGGFVAFVETPAGIVTVTIVGVALVAFLSYLACSAFSGGEKTDGGDQNLVVEPENLVVESENPVEKPGENPKEEVVPDRPACFNELSLGEKNRYAKAVLLFNLESGSSPKDFVASGEKMLGDGEFNSKWGRFFVAKGGRICLLGENGDVSDAVVSSSDGLNRSMSDLSKKVFSLFGDDVKSVSGIFAHFLTVCWVYAKRTNLFYLHKGGENMVGEWSYRVNEAVFEDKNFKSDVINTYNEIKKWVMSCRNEKA